MIDIRARLEESLLGTLTVERELGGAGMSRVFVATDRVLRRSTVVKMLPPDVSSGVSIERFRREIELAARLQHPHIVPFEEDQWLSPLLGRKDFDALKHFR